MIYGSIIEIINFINTYYICITIIIIIIIIMHGRAEKIKFIYYYYRSSVQNFRKFMSLTKTLLGIDRQNTKIKQ